MNHLKAIHINCWCVWILVPSHGWSFFTAFNCWLLEWEYTSVEEQWVLGSQGDILVLMQLNTNASMSHHVKFFHSKWNEVNPIYLIEQMKQPATSWQLFSLTKWRHDIILWRRICGVLWIKKPYFHQKDHLLSGIFHWRDKVDHIFATTPLSIPACFSCPITSNRVELFPGHSRGSRSGFTIVP